MAPKRKKCSKCKGKGEVKKPGKIGFGIGWVWGEVCPLCKGKGSSARKKKR